MRNVYHVLHRLPALEASAMPPELEELARTLVHSGRLRVDAYEKINFIRLTLPYDDIDIILSYRELHDKALLSATEAGITALLAPTYGEEAARQRAQAEMARLRGEMRKLQPVAEETEMRLARVVVQAAEPVVIKLLLWEGVEVFISYSHTIGDLLGMEQWGSLRHNAGMQQAGARITAVFISTNGDPLRPGNEGREAGDGYPALARMMVIGGQELGHYADLRRNARGEFIGRHSAEGGDRRASAIARKARLADIAHVQAMQKAVDAAGLPALLTREDELLFYGKQSKWSGRFLWAWLVLWFHKRRFLAAVEQAGLGCLREFRREAALAKHIRLFIRDMEFNLTPRAQAYERANPEEEEAVLCIEALARVPQQVNKWGRAATQALWPRLYALYYGQVIPACQQAYSALSGR